MKTHNNKDDILKNVKHVHMIGIGGSGMCPLAEILHTKGYIVTGSDNNIGDPLKRVQALGVKAYLGHAAENVADAELVVYSAAISSDNPELVEAHRRGIPTMERAELLGAVTRHYNNVIGVCGTHGKTTVTSMITQILYLNDFDPTAVIGGYLPLINANGRAGKTEYMVCEACEYVDTFLRLSPDITVLLNIDNDHLEYFKTMDNLTNSFHKFVAMGRQCFVNGDDTRCRTAVSGIDGSVTTFGFSDSNDYYPRNITPGKRGMCFDIFNNGEKLCSLALSLPGKHNVLNALAAFSVAHSLGICSSSIVNAIEGFTGAGRRFEFVCEKNGITFADDYAHHPTEITATLTAAKTLQYNNVIAVFQPFTFSRTAMLKDDFIKALENADKVILTPIMGSREVNTYGISSEQLAEKLNNCTTVADFSEAERVIFDIAKPGDLVITMGGGDIYKVSHAIRDGITL